LRIHDLIDKLKFAELVEEVKKEICKIESPFVIADGPWDKMQENSVGIISGMTRSVGLFDLRCVVKGASEDKKHSPAVIGIQLQGEDLRLFFEIKGEDNLAEKIANELYDKKLWFNLRDIPGLDEAAEYPLKEKCFNTFGNSFYYRSKKIGSIENAKLEDVSNIIISYFKSVIKDLDKLKLVVAGHL
jgi:hypothetical protein